MKNIFILVFTIIFFASCASNQVSLNNIESKKDLINQANEGSIKAMLDLNKHYNFPQTKEGLEYFNKWYKLIDSKDDKEEIFKVTKIYEDYADMFINGKTKVLNLYKLSSKLGYKPALIKQIDALLFNYDFLEARKIEDKIINTLNEDELRQLYKTYKKRYKRTDAKRVAKIIESKGYKIQIDDRITQIKKYMYSKNKKDQFNNLVNQTLDEKNKEDIQKLADYLYSRYKLTKALQAYEILLTIDPKNANAYNKIGNIYARGNYKEKLKKDITKAIKYYKKASELKNETATIALLQIYSTKKEYLEDFFKLKQTLESTTKGQLLLVKYYGKKRLKNKANEILEKLAKDGNHDALLTLALRTQSKYNFDPEEYKRIKKYQQQILNTKDKVLFEKYKNELKDKYLRSSYKEQVTQILQKDIENKNILSLRKLYRMGKYKDKENAIKYLKLASSYGDIKSSIDLAYVYTYDRKLKNPKKAIELYEKLSKEGEFQASQKLARIYMNPPRNLEKYKNVQKGLEVYETLAKQGNLKAIKKLASEYLCNSCNNGSTINYKKALIYVKKLHELGDASYTATLGWMYNFAKGVDLDLNKAKMYYEQAAEKNYSKAYYYLAWLYYKEDTDKFEIIRLDHKKAFEYLKKGAKLDNFASINLLGVFYNKGYGVKQDKLEAVKYFKKIGKYDKYASYYLGEYYRSIKEYEKAKYYFEISARRGSGAAHVELGIMHEKGEAFDKNINEALKYYKKAYNNYKSKIGAYNAALVYHYGKDGIKKDLYLARKWYRLSNTKKAQAQLKKLRNKK